MHNLKSISILKDRLCMCMCVLSSVGSMYECACYARAAHFHLLSIHHFQDHAQPKQHRLCSNTSIKGLTTDDICNVKYCIDSNIGLYEDVTYLMQ